MIYRIISKYNDEDEYKLLHWDTIPYKCNKDSIIESNVLQYKGITDCDFVSCIDKKFFDRTLIDVQGLIKYIETSQQLYPIYLIQTRNSNVYKFDQADVQHIIHDINMANILPATIQITDTHCYYNYWLMTPDYLLEYMQHWIMPLVDYFGDIEIDGLGYMKLFGEDYPIVKFILEYIINIYAQHKNRYLTITKDEKI